MACFCEWPHSVQMAIWKLSARPGQVPGWARCARDVAGMGFAVTGARAGRQYLVQCRSWAPIGRILSGTVDASIRFDDLCQLLESLGFEKRVAGKASPVQEGPVDLAIRFVSLRVIVRFGPTAGLTA